MIRIKFLQPSHIRPVLLGVLFSIISLPVHSQDSLLHLLDKVTVDSARIDILFELGDLYFEQNNYEEAGIAYENAIILARTNGTGTDLARALNKKGKLLRRSGQFDRSIKYHEEALNLALVSNDQELLAWIYNNLGVSYRRKDEDNTALKYHLEALRIAEEIDNSRLIAYSYNSIGIIYTYQGNYDEALDYYDKALKLAENNDNKVGIAINLNTIAWVYELMEDYQAAASYYLQSLEINEKSGNEEGLAICYNDLGKLYRKMGEYNLSIEYYKKTLVINEKEHDKRYLSINKINLGQVYGDIGDYETSIKELNEGLNYALELKSKRLIQDAYAQLSTTFEKLKHYEKSLEFRKLACVYQDSIYNEETARQIAEMKTIFDLERSDQQNLMLLTEKASLDKQVRLQRISVAITSSFLVLLTLLTIYLFVIRRNLLQTRKRIQLQNKQLVENEVILNELVSTKDKFFKIIAHDLRGNFNAILGFSELLKDEYKNLDTHELESLINQVHSASNNNYKLLENLLDWAKVQTSEISYSPEAISIEELILHNLSTSTGLAANKNINLKEDIESDIQVMADKHMISTVFRNLISNAVKFSNPGSTILIQSRNTEDGVMISVIDEGVGIPPRKIEKLFDIKEKNSTLGTNKEKGSGLGLVICRDFIELHGSSIKVESTLNQGTSISFNLKKA